MQFCTYIHTIYCARRSSIRSPGYKACVQYAPDDIPLKGDCEPSDVCLCLRTRIALGTTLGSCRMRAHVARTRPSPFFSQFPSSSSQDTSSIGNLADPWSDTYSTRRIAAHRQRLHPWLLASGLEIDCSGPRVARNLKPAAAATGPHSLLRRLELEEESSTLKVSLSEEARCKVCVRWRALTRSGGGCPALRRVTPDLERPGLSQVLCVVLKPNRPP